MARTALDGFRDFKTHLARFRDLAKWPAVAAAGTPFLAGLTAVSPPWPSGVEAITALTEFLTILLVYRYIQNHPLTTGRILAAGLGYSGCA